MKHLSITSAALFIGLAACSAWAQDTPVAIETDKNLLVVALPSGATGALDLAAAVRAVRARADRKDEAFFAARGLASSRGFYERFLRLGGVVAWREPATSVDGASYWLNRSARMALPSRAADAIVARLRGQ